MTKENLIEDSIPTGEFDIFKNKKLNISVTSGFINLVNSISWRDVYLRK